MATALRQVGNPIVQDYQHIVQEFAAIFGLQAAPRALAAAPAQAATMIRENPREAVQDLIRDLGGLKQDISQNSHDNHPFAPLGTNPTERDGGISGLTDDIQN